MDYFLLSTLRNHEISGSIHTMDIVASVTTTTTNVDVYRRCIYMYHKYISFIGYTGYNTFKFKWSSKIYFTWFWGIFIFTLELLTDFKLNYHKRKPEPRQPEVDSGSSDTSSIYKILNSMKDYRSYKKTVCP